MLHHPAVYTDVEIAAVEPPFRATPRVWQHFTTPQGVKSSAFFSRIMRASALLREVPPRTSFQNFLFYRYKFGAFLTLLLLTNRKVNFIYPPFFKNSSPFFHIAKFRYILPKVSLDKPKSKFYLPCREKLFSLLPARSPLFAANDLCASCTISKLFFLHRPPSGLYRVLTICSFFLRVFQHKDLKAMQCQFGPQSAFSTSFDSAT